MSIIFKIYALFLSESVFASENFESLVTTHKKEGKITKVNKNSFCISLENLNKSCFLNIRLKS